MAQSETEAKATTTQQPPPAPQPADDAPEGLSEIQMALFGLHQSFLAVSQEFKDEQKVLAIMARKSPEEVSRELPRRIAGTVVRRLSETFGTLAQVIAVFGSVEERVSALEATDDLGDVVGSPDELHDFLTDVLALCTAHTSFAVTEGDKELLARVREQAEAMLSRMDEGVEEPDDDLDDEPEEEPAGEGEPGGTLAEEAPVEEETNAAGA